MFISARQRGEKQFGLNDFRASRPWVGIKTERRCASAYANLKLEPLSKLFYFSVSNWEISRLLLFERGGSQEFRLGGREEGCHETQTCCRVRHRQDRRRE